MAITVSTTETIYYGLSTDSKPITSIPGGAQFIETDTNKRYIWNTDDTGTLSNWVELYEGVALGLALAGERNPDSATNGYQVIRNECNLAVVSTTSAATIGAGAAGDTHLIGIMIHTALTGTCAITGFGDTAGTAQTYTIPAAALGYYDFKGAINSAGALTVTCSNAGDDNKVAVLWRPV